MIFRNLTVIRQKLAAKFRPDAVGWWIRRHRAMTNMPEVENTKEFGETWKAWWTALQPAWREHEMLLKEVPDTFEWPESGLMEGGQLGIGLVVMTISWWIKAVGEDEEMLVRSGLADAIADVSWVLKQLTAVLSEIDPPTPALQAPTPKPRSKRRPSPTPVDKPHSKR